MPFAEGGIMGAKALFGEKYGDKVRVIKYGDSVELCGGTHAANTGNLGMIKIISESSIAAGIRRIEAVTGVEVERIIDVYEDSMIAFRELLNNAPDIKTAIKKSIEENNHLKKQVEEFMHERINNLKKELLKTAVAYNGLNLITFSGEIVPDVARGVALAIKNDGAQRTAFLSATHTDGKPTLLVMLTDDLVKEGLNAGKIVREAAKAIQGGGGGQTGLAQAGGRKLEGLSEALEIMKQLLG